MAVAALTGFLAVATAVAAKLPHAAAATGSPVAVAYRSAGGGYTVSRPGLVTAFGGAPLYPRTHGIVPHDICDVVATASGRGYWLVSVRGAVTAYGDARLFGARDRLVAPVVGMAPSADDRGYWLASVDGGVTAFGEAARFPDRGPRRGRVVAITATSDGHGYWLVSADSAVTAFGDAPLLRPRRPPATPVVGMARTGDGRGYWLASADGAVTAFGSAVAPVALRGTRGTTAGIAGGGSGFYLAARSGAILAFSGHGRLRSVPAGPSSTTTTTTTAGPVTEPLTPIPLPTIPVTVPSTTTTSSTAPTSTTTEPATTTTVPTPTTTVPSTTTTTPVTPPGGPLLGAVGPPVGDDALASAGYGTVVVSADWQTIEPEQGVFSASAIDRVQSDIDAASASGVDPSLDIGTQFAPAWVLSLPGGTRFVDQYGDTYGGAASSGNDVANAITDSAVRAQVGDYLAYLGAHLHGEASVRLGGGPDNELRYPSGGAGSQAGAFWFYDLSSQSLLPASAQGWTPGTGSVAQATTFLNTYNAAITNYGQWIVQQGEADFADGTRLEVLLPGWGQRPGEAAAAESALLVGTPDEINEGLDWEDLVPSLPSGRSIVAYSTYADATQGQAGNPDPAAFLHGLIPSGVRGGGESTGNGATDAAGESVMFDDARQWDWYAVGWYFNGQSQTYQQVAQAWAKS